MIVASCECCPLTFIFLTWNEFRHCLAISSTAGTCCSVYFFLGWGVFQDLTSQLRQKPFLPLGLHFWKDCVSEKTFHRRSAQVHEGVIRRHSLHRHATPCKIQPLVFSGQDAFFIVVSRLKDHALHCMHPVDILQAASSARCSQLRPVRFSALIWCHREWWTSVKLLFATWNQA